MRFFRSSNVDNSPKYMIQFMSEISLISYRCRQASLSRRSGFHPRSSFGERGCWSGYARVT